jgi:hypothetical protein
VKACLDRIPDNTTYENWRNVGAAIHAWDGGHVGYYAFDMWSRLSSKYDTSAVRQQWNRSAGMRSFSPGSLVYWAKQSDPEFVPPSWLERRNKPEVPPLLLRNRDKMLEQVRASQQRHAEHREAEAKAEASRPKSRRFPMLRCWEAAAVPRPRYLIPIGALYGPSGSLKSFLALDIALSLAHGLPWCGHDLPKSAVFYVAAEGAHGVGVRIDAWKRKHGVEGQESNFVLIPSGVNLMDAECMRDLTAEIADRCEEMDCAPALTILDTLATCAVGMEENSGKETGIALGAMSDMRHTLGCSIFAVHHTGKDAERGMRGSYRLRADLDTVIKISRAEKSMKMSAWVQKQKDGPDGLVIHFEAKPMEWIKGGALVSTLVIAPRDEAAGESAERADKIDDIRARAASLLELGVPMTRAQLCKAGDWNRGRIYNQFPQAFPPEGARTVAARHGRVRISMDDEFMITMVKD